MKAMHVHKNMRGMVMAEYVLILGALIAIFILFNEALKVSAGKRARESIRAVQNDVPCPVNATDEGIGTEATDCF